MLQTASSDTKKANARGNSQPDPGPEGLLAPPVPVLGNQAMLRLQRKCDCGGGPDCDCDMGDHKKKEGESPRTALHRAPASPGAMPQTAPPIVHETLRSPGEMLDRETRAFFESRFGQDFSGVRIHTDSRAAESARAVNALAYTVGQDIAFAPGRFAPASNEGRRLLAHELTHTLQQPHHSSGAPTVRTKLSVGDPGDTYEQEADRVTARIMGMSDPLARDAPTTSGSLRLTEQDIGSIGRQPNTRSLSLRRQAETLQQSGPVIEQKKCVERLGGCPSGDRSGIPTCDDIGTYNQQCRAETGYTGPDVFADCPSGFVPDCKSEPQQELPQQAPKQQAPEQQKPAPPACTTTYSQAKTFQALIDLVRAAEAQLDAAGISSVKDQVHALRGIYYGTTFSRDFTGVPGEKGEQSVTRNEGFQRFTRPSESPDKTVPTDVRGILACGLFDALKLSQDVGDPSLQIDFGHLIIGLDARFDPALASNVSYPFGLIDVPLGGTGTELVTWLGDLGGGAAKVALERATVSSAPVSDAFSAPSDYGGTINLEGDIAGAVVATGSPTSITTPSIPAGKKLSDALADYLSPAAPSSPWKTRAKTFLTMYGGQFDAAGTLTNGAPLIAQFAPKIQTFACNYLASRVKDKHVSFAVAKQASNNVIPASQEVAETFINAVAASAKTGDKVEAKSPFPSPKPAQTGACTVQIGAAGVLGSLPF